MREIKKDIYQDSYIYMFLLSAFLILIESLKTYSFKIFSVNLSYTLFVLPFVYLFSNYINKKFGPKKCLIATIVSSICLVLYYLIMCYILSLTIDIKSILGELSGYIVSQLINFLIYQFLLNNTKSPSILVYLNYLFSLVIYYLFYILIYLDLIILDNFWITFLITILIQAIICIPITIFDKKVKRGL